MSPTKYYLHQNSFNLVPHILVHPVWCGEFPLQQSYYGRNQKISLLDDGVQGDHPEFDRNYGFREDTDFVDGDNDGAPMVSKTTTAPRWRVHFRAPQQRCWYRWCRTFIQVFSVASSVPIPIPRFSLTRTSTRAARLT